MFILEIRARRGRETHLRACLDTLEVYNAQNVKLLVITTERNTEPKLQNKIHAQSYAEPTYPLHQARAYEWAFKSGYTPYKN